MGNRTWPQEHLDLVAGWVKAYPKGKGSFDIHRVKAERPDEWKTVLSSGRSESTIKHKGYYIAYKDIDPNRVHAGGRGSHSKRYDAATGLYKCIHCNHPGFAKAQLLGAHMRFTHPKQKRRELVTTSSSNHVMPGLSVTVPDNLVGQMVIVNPDGTVRHAETLNYCPNCGKNVRAHQAAANL